MSKSGTTFFRVQTSRNERTGSFYSLRQSDRTSSGTVVTVNGDSYSKAKLAASRALSERADDDAGRKSRPKG